MADAKIHVYSSSEAGLAVNSYLVETENGVVAVDAQLLVSEARAFRTKLEALNKPLLAVLVTHPHGDHVAGTTELVMSTDGSSEVPIAALPSVERVMRETEDEKRAQWEPVFGNEWVQSWTYPNRFVSDRETVEFDGVVYRVHDIGPGGDSEANSIWIVEEGLRAAFTGDLFFNGTHSYVADGFVLAWLANLEYARSLLAEAGTLYPGHGPEASLDRLEAQKAYLLAYSVAVRELSGGEPVLTESAKEELEARMETYLPGAPLRFMVALSADAVAAELAGRGRVLPEDL
jgi:glyoxylase-like metal-dependent hydrolase (beta-lactamase superfamily II)